MAAATGAGMTTQPFDIGYGMSSFGTIVWPTQASVRQAWQGAAFLLDTAHSGIGVDLIEYYDPMDAPDAMRLRRTALGVWHAGSAAMFCASLQRFNATTVYSETGLDFSAGVRLARRINLSGSVEASSASVHGSRLPPIRRIEAEAAMLLVLRSALVSGTLRRITLYPQHVWPGDMQVTIGLHAMHPRRGAQGVVLELRPALRRPVRVNAGMAYSLHPAIELHAAFHATPLMFAAGISWKLGRQHGWAGVVHHPVLGWSKGVGMGMLLRGASDTGS